MSSTSAATFTNEAAWQLAAGDYELETFESLGGLGTEVVNLESLGINFATPNNIYDGSSGGPLLGKFSLVNTFPYNPNNLDGFSVTASEGDLITGLGLWNASGDDRLLITFYDDLGLVIERAIVAASQGQQSFGGIVSDWGAVRVEVTSAGNANNWIAIDNLQVSVRPLETNSIPEPSISLLFLGLLAYGILVSKKYCDFEA